MCAASDSIRRPDFTAPKFKCGISWHFSAWMRAKTQEFGFNAVETCWAIDIWNPFHPFPIHFPCRYFRTICAFSIFFACFQRFSIIVTLSKIKKCYCGRHDSVERQNASIMGAGLYIWEVFGSAISMLRLCLPVAIESQIDSDSNRRCLTYVLASQLFGHELWGSRQASKLRTHSQATAAPYMICYDLLAHLHTIYRGSTFSPMQLRLKDLRSFGNFGNGIASPLQNHVHSNVL